MEEEYSKLKNDLEKYITNSMMLNKYNENEYCSIIDLKIDSHKFGSIAENDINFKIIKLLNIKFFEYNFIYIKNFNFTKLVNENIKSSKIKKELDGIICILTKYEGNICYYPLFIIEVKNSLNLIFDNIEQITTFNETTLTLKTDLIYNEKKILFDKLKDSKFIFCLPKKVDKYDLSDLTKIKIFVLSIISNFINKIKFDNIYNINIFTEYFYKCLELLLPSNIINFTDITDCAINELKELYSQKIVIDNDIIITKKNEYIIRMDKLIADKKLIDIEYPKEIIPLKIKKIVNIDDLKNNIVKNINIIINKLFINDQLTKLCENLNIFVADYNKIINSDNYLIIDNLESLYTDTYTDIDIVTDVDSFMYKYLKYKNKYLNYKKL